MSSTVSNGQGLSSGNLTGEQQGAITRLVEYDETLLVAPVGFGKAIIGLTALQELLQEGVITRALVLAPLKVATLTWGTEPEKWDFLDPGMVALAVGDADERAAVHANTAPVVVANLDNIADLKDLRGKYDAILIDESTKLKTVGGEWAKVLRYFVRDTVWRCCMTATPVAESAEDIYGQAILTDLGKTLGTRKEAFRRRYMTPADFKGYRWNLMPGMEFELAEQLRELVYIPETAAYEAGLPELVSREVVVPMTAEQRALYTGIDRGGRCTTRDGVKVIAGSSGQRALRKHQIAAGVLYGEEGKVAWSDTAKVDQAERMARASDEPMILVYQYRAELAALRERFPDAPVLGGGGSKGNASAAEIAAWNRKEHPVLLLHPQSASHGINLQYGGNQLLLLSPVFGADPWGQVAGRVRRRGQPADTVERTVLCAEDSTDGAVLVRQDEKADEEERLMAALRMQRQ